MTVCMFATCKSNKRTRSRSYFTVPKHPHKLLKSWYERSKRGDIKLADVASGSMVVCDLHFLPCQLYTKWHGGKLALRLRKGEVPQPDGVQCHNAVDNTALCLMLNSDTSSDTGVVTVTPPAIDTSAAGSSNTRPISVTPFNNSNRSQRLVNRKKVGLMLPFDIL